MGSPRKQPKSCLHSSMLSVAVLIVCSKAFTPKEWESTADGFADQPMLTQIMAKEFFMIVADTNATLNSKRLAGHMEEFDSTIKKFVTGDVAAGIIGQSEMGAFVEASITELQTIWTKFKNLIETNMVKGSGVGMAVLDEIKQQNIYVFNSAERVLTLIKSTAVVNGAPATTVIVNIASRQAVLIQRICKEVLLIALGVQVEATHKSVQETTATMDEANSGIILGAPWAGVQRLDRFCTLNQMRKVTHNKVTTKRFVDEIVAAGVQNAQETAMRTVADAVQSAEDLFIEMTEAVKLYVKDDGDCNVIGDITSDGWRFLLNAVGKQRFLTQKLAVLVVQIANVEQVDVSRTGLTIEMATTQASLRSLIEGSIANAIPAPPRQSIADQLLSTYDTWEELSREFDLVIYTTAALDVVTVEKIIRLSARILTEMDQAMQMYIGEVRAIDQSVPAYIVDVAGAQRMRLQKFAKEVGIIKYYDDNSIATKDTWDAANYTKDDFLTIHWQLLKGDPANNVSETTDLCIIKKMKAVKDSWDDLQDAGFKLAFGDKAQFKKIIDTLPVAFDLMNEAVNFFVLGVDECPEDNPTIEEWQAGIVAASEALASSQKTGTDYFWGAQSIPGPNPGMVLATFWGADGTIGEGMVHAITKLRFGWGLDKVPAPFNDQMRQEISKVSVVVTNFSRDLLLDSSEDVEYDSVQMLVEAEILMKTYMQEALTRFPDLPVNRIQYSTRLIMLANKMLKQACLLRREGLRRLQEAEAASGDETAKKEDHHGFTIVISRGDMSATQGEYASIAKVLKDGDESLNIPPLIRQRSDIEQAQANVESMYNAFSVNVECVSDSQCQDTLTAKQSLNDLEAAVTEATKLYFELDPPVPETFPWTKVVFIVIAALFCLGISAIVCRTLRTHESDAQDKSGSAVA